MSFDVAADAYDRFMGRFSQPLSEPFVALAGLRKGQRALDVGCGPGALTTRLVERLGADAVCAVDPSAPFVAAASSRFPGVDVRQAVAEQLPFDDDGFDAALAQLVVHFMSDPVAGLAEMARVTRPGGVVAACVWDHASGSGPLSTFWRAARDVDPGVRDESGLAGVQEGQLGGLFEAAGLERIEASNLHVGAAFGSFEEWWDSYSHGVGPAGAYVSVLDEAARERLRSRCAELLPAGTFEIPAVAWCVLGRA